FVSGQISLEEAITKLDTIRQALFYPLPLRVFAYGLISGGFSLLSSESLLDGVLSFFIGMLLGSFVFWLGRKKVPYFFEPFLGGMLAAYCACWVQPLFPAARVDTIVIGSIMPLLPGVTFSKSMRDLLEGNIISGSTKAVEALVIACSLAGGVGLTLAYFM
ncbi:MAG: threonine/serine exporter family protein, partial [Anaerotignum sp.]